MADSSVARSAGPAFSGGVMPKLLVLVALLAQLVACTTGGPPAPVEGRTPGGVTKTAPAARPAGASPAPPSAAGTRVFALPDETGPAVAPVPMDEAIPVPVPLPAEPVFEDPALQELMAQVDAAQSRGDSAAARSTLERAVKIKPREAGLWLRLAALNYAGGDFEQALVTAQRARDLAGPDAGTRARADDLIRRAQQGALR